MSARALSRVAPSIFQNKASIFEKGGGGGSNKTSKNAAGIICGNGKATGGRSPRGVAVNFVSTTEIRNKIACFRDLLDFSPCVASATLLELLVLTVNDIWQGYPHIKPASEFKDPSIHKAGWALKIFCDSLKSLGDSWAAENWMVRCRYDPSMKLQHFELQHIAVCMLEDIIKVGREREFDEMEEDYDDNMSDYSPAASAFNKSLSESYFDNRTTSSFCGSPVTPTSVLPWRTPSSPSFSSPMLGVGKLSPMEMKRLSYHMLPHAASIAQDPKYKILMEQQQFVDQSSMQMQRESDGDDEVMREMEIIDVVVHDSDMQREDMRICSVVRRCNNGRRWIDVENRPTPIMAVRPIPSPPPPPPLLTTPPVVVPSPPPPPPPPQPVPVSTRSAVPAPPPPPMWLIPPPPPPPTNIRLPPPPPTSTSTPPPPPPPPSMASGAAIPPPPPPPSMASGAAMPPPPPPPINIPLPPPPPTSTSTPPPPPPPPSMASGADMPPPPPPPMGASNGPPPVPATRNGAAPPPPPSAACLRPKKNATKLKRSSQMGNLYRILKGKLEGSNSQGKSGRRAKIGGGAAAAPGGGKQGMADALAEMTKRSAYFIQIEEDVKKYEGVIKELKSSISNFQTSDMSELVKFHKHIESHLEKLADETQVLARFEEFPSKKLEAIRMASALHLKLDSIVSTLQNWQFLAPVGKLLDKAEAYFNKMKVELDALERTKDEEMKRFQAQKIIFDFGILLRIKELLVDVSSNCMELALKEKREAAKAKEGKEEKGEGKSSSNGSAKILWRAFQFAFRVYTFAGGHDDRADKLTKEVADEIETQN